MWEKKEQKIESLELELMFKQSQEQQTSPSHEETKVLQEEHDTRPAGLHTVHLRKLGETMREREKEI